MRVVIADDAVLIRTGIVKLLEEFGHEVVAAVAEPTDLVNAIVHHRPDVSIVDVRMPPSFVDEGLRAALEVRESIPDSPVLILSQYVESSYAEQLVASPIGAVGYLLKERVIDVDDFMDALNRVATGGTVFDPEVIAQLMTRQGKPLEKLTHREREVLGLMAEGFSNQAIARKLVVSGGAVEKHIRNIFTKLELKEADNEQHRRVKAVLAFLNG
ncbi:response regulator transcription factor [Haloglycomyces albus]|uniref:response regulator transcription factor n=1 Tax=Haloglycomyces albus TaxID=526067 RepID=UPI00046CA403|nr:response regulator transcription factor [Haloglycomyces albus]